MRRLRSVEGTAAHRKAASYHIGACRRVKTAVHDQLREEMAARYQELVARERAVEDAEDACAQTTADMDAAEIDLENVIRDGDAELAKLDRADPALNAQRSVFPDGFGAVINPEGEAQLGELPALRVRLQAFAAHPPVTEIIVRLTAAGTALGEAVEANTETENLVEARFAEEQIARAAVREQLESAYGRLRDLYKSKPALAERFFQREMPARRAKTEAKPAQPAAQPAQPA